jgi:hypothetical protein
MTFVRALTVRGLTPLIVIRSGIDWPYSVWLTRQVAPDTREWGTWVSGGYTGDPEVRIYLVAR